MIVRKPSRNVIRSVLSLARSMSRSVYGYVYVYVRLMGKEGLMESGGVWDMDCEV